MSMIPRVAQQDSGPSPVRHFDELPFAERFVVWAMRYWTELQNPKGGLDSRHQALCPRNVALPLMALGALMQVHDASARRPLVLNSIQACELSPDEELILHATGAIQAGDHATAHMILHHFLPCAAVRLASVALQGFADKLLAANLVIRPSAASRSHVEALALNAGLPSLVLN
jgi:hypothetical protein